MLELAVALENPKYAHNVGGVLRACSVYGASKLRWSGHRVVPDNMRRLPREERMKAYRNVDFAPCGLPWMIDTIVDNRLDWSIVAVELVPTAEQLPDFEHPTINTCYVFGPEDGSISRGLRTMCDRFVMIPTAACMNLSAAVNVTLYDRYCKRRHLGLEPIRPTSEYV
jgi:tRNA(Leu) C34 or U34 (ribose-2'-O)-methylase TrmL